MYSTQIENLKKLIEINSFTRNIDGVNAVGEFIQELLKNIPLEWEKTERFGKGDLLVAKTIDMDDSKPKILLSCHLDTIFKKNWEIRIEGDKFYGPGAINNKTSALLIVEAIKDLHKKKLLKNLIIMFGPDEEEGMGHLHKQEEYYKNVDYAMVYEDSEFDLKDTNPKERAIVTQRRAMSFFDINLSGPGGHNARLTEAKDRHSTIFEACKIVMKLENLTDFDRHTYINVGTFHSGFIANAVPDDTTMRVDIRYGDRHEIDKVRVKLFGILKSSDPEIKLNYKETLFYPSFDTTEKVDKFADLVIEEGEKIGLNIQKQVRSGTSNANFISAANIECSILDGFGVAGGGDHSRNEFFFIESFQQSVDLSTNVIIRILQ